VLTIDDYKVSIRASLQQRGEQVPLGQNFNLNLFQSAPHFSSEANALVPAEFAEEFVSIRASLQQRGEQLYLQI